MDVVDEIQNYFIFIQTPVMLQVLIFKKRVDSIGSIKPRNILLLAKCISNK